MNRSQYAAIAAILILAVACFMPWVHIVKPGITISGIDSGGTRYGKPALNHFILATLILACIFIPRIWAKRFNLLFAALNLAWAIRNFAVLPRCEAGECPDKLWGIYLVLISSAVLLLTTFFPDIKIDENAQNKEAT